MGLVAVVEAEHASVVLECPSGGIREHPDNGRFWFQRSRIAEDPTRQRERQRSSRIPSPLARLLQLTPAPNRRPASILSSLKQRDELGNKFALLNLGFIRRRWDQKRGYESCERYVDEGGSLTHWLGWINTKRPLRRTKYPQNIITS